MKKKWNIVFVSLCLAICIIPFASMAFFRTDATTENKRLTELPDFWENGTLNTEYFEDLGAYFEDRFAFRQQLVSADSEIQSKVFGVSNVDTVIKGTDGWLYYTATLDDYLGQNTLSERSVYNVTHNLSLLQQYVEGKGASFLFTVAPNKNSLYGEHMPYYYQSQVSNVKNMTLLQPALESAGLHYLDLFPLFTEQEEVLYLKRDSHWNQKGALMVYNALLDALQHKHETYADVPVARTETEYGDLNKMLYPLTAEPEWNYTYQYESRYTYVTPTESVEDAWIQTVNPNQKGTLLMFRDSFGNSLLPFMADAFQNGYFSKATPYNIAAYMELYQSDAVIVEIVERNVGDFAEKAPIMQGPAVKLKADTISPAAANGTISMAVSEANFDYLEISGVLDEAQAAANTNVYVKITVGSSEKTYEAFTVSTEESDYGYLLYLAKAGLQPTDRIQVEVIAETDGQLQSVATASFSAGEFLSQTIDTQ